MEQNKKMPRKALGTITNIINQNQDRKAVVNKKDNSETSFDPKYLQEKVPKENENLNNEVILSLENFTVSNKQPGVAKEFDSKEIRDFYNVKFYHNDFLVTLKEQERLVCPKINYFTKQTDLNDNMRRILVGWLGEICTEYSFDTETLHLAVNYIDRFLGLVKVKRQKLQLVGTSAIFLATKYEEIDSPGIDEFVFLTDYAYTREEVLRMERLVLKALEFQLKVPTSYTILRMFCVILNVENQVRFLAEYLCELTLYTAMPWLAIIPSAIATTALVLANYLLGQEMWNESLSKLTDYQWSDIKRVLIDMNELHQNAEAFTEQSIQLKYSSDCYMRVALIPPKNISIDELNKIVA